MLFEDALPVGDVVLMFDWERPAGAACNLQPDRASGWRKELNGLGVWGRRAGAFFDDARVAVLSELTFYETQVQTSRPAQLAQVRWWLRSDLAPAILHA